MEVKSEPHNDSEGRDGNSGGDGNKEDALPRKVGFPCFRNIICSTAMEVSFRFYRENVQSRRVASTTIMFLQMFRWRTETRSLALEYWLLQESNAYRNSVDKCYDEIAESLIISLKNFRHFLWEFMTLQDDFLWLFWWHSVKFFNIFLTFLWQVKRHGLNHLGWYCKGREIFSKTGPPKWFQQGSCEK